MSDPVEIDQPRTDHYPPLKGSKEFKDIEIDKSGFIQDTRGDHPILTLQKVANTRLIEEAAGHCVVAIEGHTDEWGGILFPTTQSEQVEGYWKNIRAVPIDDMPGHYRVVADMVLCGGLLKAYENGNLFKFSTETDPMGRDQYGRVVGPVFKAVALLGRHRPAVPDTNIKPQKKGKKGIIPQNMADALQKLTGVFHRAYNNVRKALTKGIDMDPAAVLEQVGIMQGALDALASMAAEASGEGGEPPAEGEGPEMQAAAKGASKKGAEPAPAARSVARTPSTAAQIIDDQKAAAAIERQKAEFVKVAEGLKLPENMRAAFADFAVIGGVGKAVEHYSQFASTPETKALGAHAPVTQAASSVHAVNGAELTPQQMLEGMRAMGIADPQLLEHFTKAVAAK